MTAVQTTAGEHRGHAPAILFNLYRLGWLSLLAVAIFVTAAGAWMTDRYYKEVFTPFVSLGLRWNYDRTVSLTVPVNRDGGLATIEAGDVILSVEGHPVPHDGDHIAVLTRQLAAAPGPVVNIRTRSKDGAVRDHALARVQAGASMQFQSSLMSGRALLVTQQVIAAFVSGLAIVAALLLFMRRARDPAAAIMSVGFLLMAISGRARFAFTSLAPGTYDAGLLLATLALPTILFAVLTFPTGRLHSRWARVLAAAISLQMVVSVLENFEILQQPLGPLRPVTIPLLMVLSVLALFLRYRRLPAGVQKQQIRWVLFGFACAAAMGPVSFTTTTIAYASTNVRWSTVLIAAGSTLNALGLLFAVGGLLISLLRYRLYDADAVISRSATFAIVTLGLGAAWAGAEQAIEAFLEGSMGHGAGAASAGIAAAVAALLVSPVHERVRNWTETVFQRKLVNLRRTLPEVVGDLRETASINELAAVVLEQVTTALRARHGAILLETENGLAIARIDGVPEPEAAAWLVGFNCSDAEPEERQDPLFPLRHRLVATLGGPAQTVGWLLLGPRPDGSFYGKDELEALNEAAGPIARALHVVQRRQARESAILNELSRLRDEVAGVHRAATRQAAHRPA